MIANSFIFLDKIGEKLEKSIWQQGILSWDQFLAAKSVKGISRKRKMYYDRIVLQARSALYSQCSGYFIGRLPQCENWRLYDNFKDQAVFLDIETSGMSRYDDITVFGIFDGINTKTMIRGINMDYKELKKELDRYKLIVTYNGSTFDIPFIRKRYPRLLPQVPNFDLRVACQRVNLTGGLKEIEKKFGIERSKIVEDMYGGDALRLWKMYRVTGDSYYLKLLVEYNEEDVYNLKKIADTVTARLKHECLAEG